MNTNSVPKGYHTITPYLFVRGVERLLEFLEQAFDAQQTELIKRPDGTILHAEVRIGDSVVMMGEARADQPLLPAMLYVYLDDVDGVYRRALAAGAASLKEPGEEFYGDRTATVQDASGNRWELAKRVENLSPEEIQRRADDRPGQA